MSFETNACIEGIEGIEEIKTMPSNSIPERGIIVQTFLEQIKPRLDKMAKTLDSKGISYTIELIGSMTKTTKQKNV